MLSSFLPTGFLAKKKKYETFVLKTFQRLPSRLKKKKSSNITDIWDHYLPVLELILTIRQNVRTNYVLIYLSMLFVSNQYPLNSTVSRQIITEIRSLTDICDVLSSLDIAIGFLSSTGGKSDMLLEEYLREVLRMDEQNCLRSLKVDMTL